jgi:hypothetical protein
MIARVFQNVALLAKRNSRQSKGLPEKAFSTTGSIRTYPRSESQTLCDSADERRIDVAHDRRDKVIGYEIDRVAPRMMARASSTEPAAKAGDTPTKSTGDLIRVQFKKGSTDRRYSTDMTDLPLRRRNELQR